MTSGRLLRSAACAVRLAYRFGPVFSSASASRSNNCHCRAQSPMRWRRLVVCLGRLLQQAPGLGRLAEMLLGHRQEQEVGPFTRCIPQADCLVQFPDRLGILAGAVEDGAQRVVGLRIFGVGPTVAAPPRLPVANPGGPRGPMRRPRRYHWPLGCSCSSQRLKAPRRPLRTLRDPPTRQPRQGQREPHTGWRVRFESPAFWRVLRPPPSSDPAVIERRRDGDGANRCPAEPGGASRSGTRRRTNCR